MKKPADEVPDIDSDSPLLCESEDLNIDIEDAVSARKGPVSVRSGPRRFPSSHRKRSGFPYYQSPSFENGSKVNDENYEENRCEGLEHEDLRTDVSVMHEAIQDAVTGAFQDAVQEVVQEAVQEAVQNAVDEGMKFDVRANLYTLIAITGVVLYWRGIWTTWDHFFGFSIWSEVAAIVLGLAIMVAFRLFKMPLLDGLPSG